jgi:hypothetical protein
MTCCLSLAFIRSCEAGRDQERDLHPRRAHSLKQFPFREGVQATAPMVGKEGKRNGYGFKISVSVRPSRWSTGARLLLATLDNSRHVARRLQPRVSGLRPTLELRTAAEGTHTSYSPAIQQRGPYLGKISSGELQTTASCVRELSTIVGESGKRLRGRESEKRTLTDVYIS